MSINTSTGDQSTDAEKADQADQSTGGNTETGNGSEARIKELEGQINRGGHKMRGLEKSIKELTTKITPLLEKLAARDDEDDIEDDEADLEEDADANAKDDGKEKAQNKKSGQNPALARVMKQLKRARQEAETREKELIADRDAWRDELARERKNLLLEGLLRRNGARESMLKHAVRIIGPDIEHHVEEDRSMEYTHPEYGSAAKFVEVWLTDNPDFVANTRKSGTGDGGGADRSGGVGDGVKLPGGWSEWSKERRTAWINNLKPEQRRGYMKELFKRGA